MSDVTRTAEPETTIVAEHLTMRYGRHLALEDVSFTVRAGEVVAFLGPNGAGKTTTLRILTGWLRPTSGRAAIAGFDVVRQGLEARAALGYQPETVAPYGELRVREYLGFRAELKGVPSRRRWSEVDSVLDRVRLREVAAVRIDHLSKGMRQRVGLADALVARPKVLILDEPTAGMDPNQIREVRALVRDLEGHHTVLLSTHILSEAEATCSRAIVIDRGRVVASGSPAELSARAGRRGLRLTVRWSRGRPDPLPEPLLCARVVDVGTLAAPDTESMQFDSGSPELAEQVVAAAVAAGGAVREVRFETERLEEVFATLTERRREGIVDDGGTSPSLAGGSLE